jgi:phage tail protein X
MSEYKSVQGDTWDLISFKIWKNEFYTSDLIKANPEHNQIVFFDAGVVLNVPDIEIVDETEKPPWR